MIIEFSIYKERFNSIHILHAREILVVVAVFFIFVFNNNIYLPFFYFKNYAV